LDKNDSDFRTKQYKAIDNITKTLGELRSFNQAEPKVADVNGHIWTLSEVRREMIAATERGLEFIEIWLRSDAEVAEAIRRITGVSG